MELKRIPFSYLLKQELPTLARDVKDIVEKHDPEVLKVSDVFDLLVAQTDNIKLLDKCYGANPVTKQLVPVRKNCYMYAQAIVYGMRLVVKKNANDLPDAVVNTEAVVISHLNRISASKNESVVISRLAGFFEAIEQDEALELALDSFGLTEHVDNLQSAFSTLKELLVKRNRMKSERSSARTRELTEVIVKALQDLIKQIEIAQLTNKEMDYALLYSELNEKIQDLRNKVSIRLLYNKRKAEGLDVDGFENESTNSEVESTVMMNNLNVETMSGNGFEERFEEQLDPKKTVAKSSGKQLQLPSINDEA